MELSEFGNAYAGLRVASEGTGRGEVLKEQGER